MARETLKLRLRGLPPEGPAALLAAAGAAADGPSERAGGKPAPEKLGHAKPAHAKPGKRKRVLVLPLYQGLHTAAATLALPPACRAAARAAGFSGAAGQSLLLRLGKPLLLLGLGEASKQKDYEAAGGQMAAALTGFRTARLLADGLPPAHAAALAVGAALRAWRGDFWKTRENPGESAEAAPLRRLVVLVHEPVALGPAWRRARAALQGQIFARRLVVMPGNLLGPDSFVQELRALERQGLSVEVLGRGRLTAMGAGGLLAVGGGAPHGPYLVVLRWRGTGGRAPVVFVGKGITFDTGGISIKPAAGMEEMRADMAGAAACAGAMLALARRRSPMPAAAVLAIAENTTDAASYRPGDVLRMLAGSTVEVIDTDAEGRLVLADALHHAVATLRPRAMLDLATLTGSIVVALGHHQAGAFGTDPTLIAAAQAAGAQVGEPLWPMPIGDSHREDLASEIADIKQCCAGRGQPDACHAAAFLRTFVGETPWAHLDIAGVEARMEATPQGPVGPTGFGARLLDALVERHFEPAPDVAGDGAGDGGGDGAGDAAGDASAAGGAA